MQNLRQKQQFGFTIVELLIVIVVIGILAAITIVAFNGVQNKAKVAALQSELTNASKKLNIYKFTPGSNEQYPADLATAGLTATSGMTYFPNGDSYCLVDINGNNSYYVTSTSGVQQGACMISDQLVGWWKFNSNASDSSGNAINGTNNGATLTTGQNGQANSAYQFNGTSSNIALPSATPLNLTNNFSVSAWIKLNSDIGSLNWNDIIAGSTSDWGVGINVNTNGDGRLRLTKISVADAPSPATTVQKQVWKHVAMTYSNNTVKYYLDGQPDGAGTASSQFNTLTSTTKYIGMRGNISGYFHGAIDDLRVYNKVLSDNEVNVIYSGGAQ